jgi:nicotinate phosphoribosyltransferase
MATQAKQPSFALMTDLYEVTMAYAYMRSDMADREAVFDLFFRKHPFQGGYTVACGLERVVDYLANFRFSGQDCDYLSKLTGSDDQPLFDDAFLSDLRDMQLQLDVHAVPEGTVVFPLQPLVRVRGPIAQCQLLESALLNFVNFQSLVATKAARIASVADGPVLEFGLRRAQGPDGALSVGRATYIGGCGATSNVMAGATFGIPVKGTHAHSWVMAFDDEQEAFERFAKACPNNSILLVDTFDSIAGVRKAIAVGREMRRRGQQLNGIRLDSGDLAYLSVEARKLLDEAGFSETKIVASGDLDEHLIQSLKRQGAQIDIWGVGTKLATAYDEPALNGVYKLTAIRAPEADWAYRIKLSEQMVKITTPGLHQVRRFEQDGLFIGDMLYDEKLGPGDEAVIVAPEDPLRSKNVPTSATYEDLLVPVMHSGELVYDPPGLEAIRQRVQDQLAKLHPGIKRLENPHEYPAGLEPRLSELKRRLVKEARERVQADTGER